MDQETDQTLTYNVPILFTIFNRTDTTGRVFEQIRKLQPKYLYVAADGAREHKEGEAERCQQTRDLVLKNIDWDCEVKTLLRDHNLGCKVAMSSAITWFFENVEMGIILEDDCLPHPSFFNYMKELLEKYRHDDRVMLISGQHTQSGTRRGSASYYFSRYPHIWGWGSWKRAWAKYDVKTTKLPDFKQQNQIANLFDNPAEQEFWMKNFQVVHDNQLDTWDYQWVFTIFSNSGLCILPNVNLISNIGFQANATHTTDVGSELANVPTQDIGSITHPEFMVQDKQADEFESANVFHIPPVELVPRAEGSYRKLIKQIPQPWKDSVKKVIKK